MTDGFYIQQMIKRGRDASEKVKTNFSGLSLEQLNWKPGPDAWSVGQCLDHLIVGDCLYFPAFEKIVQGNYSMTGWQKRSPFGRLFGKMLVSQLQEHAKRKVKTARVFYPSQSQVDDEIFGRFHTHLDTLLEYIGGFKEIDLDKIHITSPISKFITYNLRDAVTILVHHEHRHINQAIRVKSREEFPK